LEQVLGQIQKDMELIKTNWVKYQHSIEQMHQERDKRKTEAHKAEESSKSTNALDRMETIRQKMLRGGANPS
jgi:uncharacterized protein (DUF3084 family)